MAWTIARVLHSGFSGLPSFAIYASSMYSKRQRHLFDGMQTYQEIDGARLLLQLIRDPAPNALHPNQILKTFELLHVRNCGGPFLDKLCTWLQSQGLQFRSLEFAPADDVTFEPLPSVLATSSNALTSLCLDLGVCRACMSPLVVCERIINTLCPYRCL